MKAGKKIAKRLKQLKQPLKATRLANGRQKNRKMLLKGH